MKYNVEKSVIKKNVNISTKKYGLSVGKYLLYSVLILLGISLFMRVFAYFFVGYISHEKEYRRFSSISFIEDDVVTGYEWLLEGFPIMEYSNLFVVESEEANAYTVPGRNVYVTTQLIEESDSLEELYFVIGHEFGHMERRDSLRNLMVALPIELLAAMLFQGSGSGRGVISASIINTYGRSAELESDKYGLDFVHKHFGHVGCALDFFQKDLGEGSEILTWGSSHPISSTRIIKAKEYTQEQGYAIANCTSLPDNKE